MQVSFKLQNLRLLWPFSFFPSQATQWTLCPFRPGPFNWSVAGRKFCSLGRWCFCSRWSYLESAPCLGPASEQAGIPHPCPVALSSSWTFSDHPRRSQSIGNTPGHFVQKETHVPVGMGAWLQEGWPWGKQPGLLSVGAVLGSGSVPLRAPSLGDLVGDLTEREGRGVSRVSVSAWRNLLPSTSLSGQLL